MARTEVETLVVSLEGRLNKYEKAMAKAQGVSDKRMRAIEQRGSLMQRRLAAVGSNAFTGLIRGAALALGPILGISAALNTAKAALHDFDSIGKSAKATGLDAESFQEFAYAAKLGGVEADAFSKALETFAKNAGLAAVGKGRMVTQLKALNPALLEAIRNATNQAERVRLAADAIDRAGSSSEAAALSTVLFGDAGTRMTEVFRGGSSALDATARKARELGIVIDNDLIARAETMNDKFETATRVMDLQFKQALIDLAPILIATAQLAGNLAGAINGIVDAMRNLETRSTARLEHEFEGLDRLIRDANPQRGADFKAGAMDIQIEPGKLAELIAERDAIYAELKRRAVSNLAADLRRKTTSSSGSADDDAGGGGGGGGGGGNRNAAIAETLRQADAVATLIERLEHEKSLIGRSSTDQAVANALREAGAAATDEQKARIESLVRTMAEERAALEANAEAMAAFGDAAADALGRFIDDLIEGKDLAASLADILGDLGKQLIKQGINEGIKVLIRGISGGFADGGYTGPGGRLQPAGVVHKGEYVFDKPSVDRIGVANLEAMRKGLKGFADGVLVMPRIASPAARGGGAPAAAPQVDARTKVVNAFDGASFLSEALSSAEGEKVLLNFVKARPGAFRAAMQQG